MVYAESLAGAAGRGGAPGARCAPRDTSCACDVAAACAALSVLFDNPVLGWRKGGSPFAGCRGAQTPGIEPIELKPGEDLEVLVHEAVEGGADQRAMAGGDWLAGDRRGAAPTRPPYAVRAARVRIPRSTRRGSLARGRVLDVFRHGGERIVDLAEINERVRRERRRAARRRCPALRAIVTPSCATAARRRTDVPRRGAGQPGAGRGRAATWHSVPLFVEQLLPAGRASGRHAGAHRRRPPASPCSPGRLRRHAGCGPAEARANGRPWASRSTPTGPSRHRRRGHCPTRHFVDQARWRRPSCAPALSPSATAPEGVRRAGPSSRQPPLAARRNRRSQRQQARTALMEITEKERLKAPRRPPRGGCCWAICSPSQRRGVRPADHFKVDGAMKVELKLEIEIEDDEKELEAEIKW